VSYRCFEVSVEDGVAHVVLNRPEKRNSLIPEFWEELPGIAGGLDAEGGVRCIVISSAGSHFSSGIDVSAFGDGGAVAGEDVSPHGRRQHGARLYALIGHLQESFNALERCRVPVLAAIQGGCIGGGVDLVTACDMRYAADGAFFTIFETNIGMTASSSVGEGGFRIEPRTP